MGMRQGGVDSRSREPGLARDAGVTWEMNTVEAASATGNYEFKGVLSSYCVEQLQTAERITASLLVRTV